MSVSVKHSGQIYQHSNVIVTICGIYWYHLTGLDLNSLLAIWVLKQFQYNIMVNGLHLYSAFIQSSFQYCLTFIHSCTHSHTNGGVDSARRQPARWEQLGLGDLLRDTSTLSEEELGIELSTLRFPANKPETAK